MAKRVPSDSFEAELFRDVLVSRFARWEQLGRPLKVQVGEHRDEDPEGEYPIYIEPADAPFDAVTFLTSPSVVGTAWIEDTSGLPISYEIRWQVPTQDMVQFPQSSDAGTAPIVMWR